MKSPTFWVAFAALVVSLSSTAVAASIISGKNIKKGSIPGNRLAKNTVTGDRVKNKSLSGADMKSNTLTGKQIAESKLSTVPRSITAGAAANTGQFGGLPPGAYVRNNSVTTPGVLVSGAFGCTGPTTSCVTSFPSQATVDLTATNIRVGPGGVCNGSAREPNAPAGVVCLYPTGGTVTGTSPMGAGSRFGFIVQGSVQGVWAYKAPTPPVPE